MGEEMTADERYQQNFSIWKAYGKLHRPERIKTVNCSLSQRGVDGQQEPSQFIRQKERSS